VRDWSELSEAFAESNLIVQTTTLGMAGTESPDWPIDACSADTIVVDVVYRPLETPLLAAARARGLKTVDGLGMLIHQGARYFEIWFGIKPDVAKARARLEAALA
jgi:shikimate dehydrogenase